MGDETVKNFQFERFKSDNISSLKDISEIQIDDGKAAVQRALSFINQVNNPYFFKVGNTPVKIVFAKKYAQVSIETKLAKIVNGKVG